MKTVEIQTADVCSLKRETKSRSHLADADVLSAVYTEHVSANIQARSK